MAAELKDFRGKITALTWVFVEAEHRATGKDHAEIVRDVLHRWAEQKHAEVIEARKLLKCEGIEGSRGESEGVGVIRREVA
jgi:hypothetical protein